MLRTSTPSRQLNSTTPGKTALFFGFSLCLSRACLGKIMHFIYKWLKKCRFLTAERLHTLRLTGSIRRVINACPPPHARKTIAESKSSSAIKRS
eukprot:COSAG06_NODE_745_length_12649_cov_128.650916_3_plen_94_part_00